MNSDVFQSAQQPPSQPYHPHQPYPWARRVYAALLYVLIPLLPIYLLLRSRKQPEYRDHWAERFACYGAARERLLEAYPKHAFVGEESGFFGPEKATARWIVDPIDGTTNFIHGLPHYCICIALELEGKLEHAVIYNPATNDIFTASRGSGAFLNNRRIRVSSRVRIPEALMASAMPSRVLRARPELLALQTKLRFESAGFRHTGSAALDLAYVAAGYLDGLKEWDLAAGALLIKEAGGLITDLRGEGDYMNGDIVAATPKLLPALLREIDPAINTAL